MNYSPFTTLYCVTKNLEISVDLNSGYLVFCLPVSLCQGPPVCKYGSYPAYGYRSRILFHDFFHSKTQAKEADSLHGRGTGTNSVAETFNASKSFFLLEGNIGHVCSHSSPLTKANHMTEAKGKGEEKIAIREGGNENFQIL